MLHKNTKIIYKNRKKKEFLPDFIRSELSNLNGGSYASLQNNRKQEISRSEALQIILWLFQKDLIYISKLRLAKESEAKLIRNKKYFGAKRSFAQHTPF